uniref:Uncharacterized protein n=1 Tax=Oryza brachyantha TaxID=4533 RepID=J3N7Z4_ORYBR
MAEVEDSFAGTEPSHARRPSVLAPCSMESALRSERRNAGGGREKGEGNECTSPPSWLRPSPFYSLLTPCSHGDCAVRSEPSAAMEASLSDLSSREWGREGRGEEAEDVPAEPPVAGCGEERIG